MIKKYFATKDNTITNAFGEDLTTRGTGSNMGASDILEVFSIHAQASSSSGLSSELSRVLVEFDITEITADRSSGAIPNSGSVSFFLKLYDVPHSQTVPRDFTLTVSGISGSWQEGYGIDMDYYKDLTRDGIGSNWINASNNFVTASTTITVVNGTAVIGMTEKEHITITSTDGTTKRYVITDADKDGDTATGTLLSDSDNTDTGAGTAGSDEDGAVAVSVDLTGGEATAQNEFLVQLKAAIEHANGHNGKIIVSSVPNPAAGNQSITLQQLTTGRSGNSTVTGNIDQIITPNFTGGDGQWSSQGGDFYSDTSSSFNQAFPEGFENLEVDVTTLVEQWMNSTNNVLGSKTNHGFGIQLSSSLETTNRSFFTKKFFGRETEFFVYRPSIEARFDDSKKDDRGNFYLSSSLAPPSDNMNTIYLYNYVRGKLRNIPSIGGGKIGVSLFSSSLGAPVGSAFQLVTDGSSVLTSNNLVVTGGFVSTGIYSASVAFTGSSSLTKLHDVWFPLSNTVSNAGASTTQFVTGTIEPKRFLAQGFTNEQNYVLSMPNLQNRYRQNETPKIELYVREKNWSPNIFNIATNSSIPSVLIESASYQIKRSIDDLVVVPYGTGSIKYTELSYDVSGNYFHLDTGVLEGGYNYEICFAFYNEDSSTYVQQPQKFKFRVVNDEY